MTPELIATGELLPVENTLFDLRQPTLLSSRACALSTTSTETLRHSAQEPQPVSRHAQSVGLPSAEESRYQHDTTPGGYDDCFLVNRAGIETGAGRLALCARVKASQSGRVMEVWSTEPALQFYSGLRPQEALPGPPGKGGRTYFQQMGLCFEPEGYPNAPNCPAFPSAVCAPGKGRGGSTVYRFGTEVLPCP